MMSVREKLAPPPRHNLDKLEGLEEDCDMLEASGKHLNTPSHNGHRLSPVAKEQGSNNSVVGEDIIG